MGKVSDDFNRSDANPLDGSWAGGYTGANNLQIVGNEVRQASLTGNLDCIASHTTARSNPQWAKSTLVTFNDTGISWVGELVRFAAPTTLTGYGGGGFRNHSIRSWIAEWSAGSIASLVSENAVTWAATDNITLAARDTILNLYRNGGVPLLTITDASNASGRIGQHCYATNSLSSAEIDNFVGGDLIEVVGVGAEASAANGDITLNAPSGTPQNDDIWIAMVHSSDQVAHSMDAAWTQIVQGNGGGTTSRLSVWYHRYAGSTPDLVVTHTAGQSPIGGIVAFRGCKTSGSPVNVAGTINGGIDASIETNGVTITVDGSLLLAINGAADDNARTLLSGWTNLLEDSGGGTQNAYVTTAGNPDGSVSAFYVDTFPGSTGTVTVTQGAADAWASVLIALEPAASGTLTPVSIDATAVGVATYSRVLQLKRTLTSSAVGVPTVTKQLSLFRTLTASSTGVPTVSKLMQETLNATAVGVSSLSKLMSQTLDAAAVGVATLVTALSFTKLLEATAVGTATLTIVKMYRRTLDATSTGVATIQKLVSKTLEVSSVGVATFQKLTSKTLDAIAIGVATLTNAAAVEVLLEATSVGVATVQKLVSKTLDASSVGVASIQKLVSKTLSATSSGVATIQRLTKKTLDAIATGVPTMTDVSVMSKSIDAIATGVVTLTTQLMVGAAQFARRVIVYFRDRKKIFTRSN